MISINGHRLKENLEEINNFGLNEVTQGINRVGFGEDDFKARRWLMAKMSKIGLRTWMDKVGNVFGRLGPEDGECIMSGSHLDSVPEGGKYDGVLGVMSALESVQAIQDANIDLKYAIEVVAFAEEEGRFGGMLGSQALSGQVDPEWLENSKDVDGIKLSDAMASQNLNYKDALTSGRTDIKQFVEIHIEQGPVLEKSDLSIGIVDSISGTSNPLYTIVGEANHSGTTPMHLRKDASCALFEIGAHVPQLIKQHGSSEARLTIGKCNFFPNFPHTVPGKVEFSVNIRDTDSDKMDSLDAAFLRKAEDVCQQGGFALEVDRSLGRLEPVSLDSGIKNVLVEEAEKLIGAGQYTVMPSGAGHDAQQMQRIAKSGMIFIPSQNGVSHSPEEFTDHEHIVQGTQLLCNALLRLATS